MTPRFPGSKTDYLGDGTTYGPLPDHGKGPLKIALHTTETRGMPSFGNGDTAPHYVYDATNKDWYVWSDVDRRVGTMKGHSTNHCNCDSIQVEILGYSDGSHNPWVGDFDDEDYNELARFFRWAINEGLVGDDVTPQPADGWKYGSGSPFRLTESEWEDFSGLTCHGAAPGNSHWDTGVLDLVRIHDLATGEDMPTGIKKGGYVEMDAPIDVPAKEWTEVLRLDRPEGATEETDLLWATYLRVLSGDYKQVTVRFIRDPDGDRDITGTDDNAATPGKEFIAHTWPFGGVSENVAVEVYIDGSGGTVEWGHLKQKWLG